jgi:hypothetical protein
MLKPAKSAQEIVNQISIKFQEDDLSFFEVVKKEFSFELIFYKNLIEGKNLIRISTEYGDKKKLRPPQWLKEYFEVKKDEFLNQNYEIK